MKHKSRFSVRPALEQFSNRIPAIKLKGFVKWFNDAKGFGFVCSGGVDYFAHYTDIVGGGHKKLDPYQEVEFTPSQNLKGPRARGITPV